MKNKEEILEKIKQANQFANVMADWHRKRAVHNKLSDNAEKLCTTVQNLKFELAYNEALLNGLCREMANIGTWLDNNENIEGEPL